jgi:hypothetical protein
MDIIKQAIVRVQMADNKLKSEKCLIVKDLLVKYMVDNAESISEVYIKSSDDRDVDIETDVSADLIRDLNNVPYLNVTVEERLDHIVRLIHYEHGVRITVRLGYSYDNDDSKDGWPVVEHDKVIITIHT